jgi:hypothetical protein
LFFLGYNAVLPVEGQPLIRRNKMPPSLWLKNMQSSKTIMKAVGRQSWLSVDYTALYSRRWDSS